MNNYRKPFLIAEIGCNHMGDMDTAKELILLAKNTKTHLRFIKNYILMEQS